MDHLNEISTFTKPNQNNRKAELITHILNSFLKEAIIFCKNSQSYF